MKKMNIYIKNLSLFLILELFFVFICSLLNLAGIKESISTILLFVYNVILFMFFGFNHGKTNNKKGYLTGFLTGLILLIILFLVNILFFKGDFKINQILYYTILIISSTFGGMYGKSKKIIDSKEK